MTLSEFDLDSLPEVKQGTPSGSRLPRFDGDVSELPNQACWALQNLLARRYIHKDLHPDLWSWVMEYRTPLTKRLSELDLRLRIHEDFDVAYAEQATTDVQHNRSRKLLRREPMSLYASILGMHLARIFNSNRAEHLISLDDIHELFSAIPRTKDRDEAMVRKRTDEAIAKMEKLEVLLRSSEDTDSFSISPVIAAIVSGNLLDQLQSDYQRLMSTWAEDTADNNETPTDPTDPAAVINLDAGDETEYGAGDGDNDQ